MGDGTAFEADGSTIPWNGSESGAGEPAEAFNSVYAPAVSTVRPDATRSYFREILRFQQLSPQQEIALAREIKNGSAEAREQFISSNLRLVVSIAKRFHWRCTAAISLIDLIQEGNIGLVKAVGRFNYEAGFRFSTYATYLIRQSIESYLKQHAKTVRSPAHIQNMHKKYDDTVAILHEELGRTPSTDEIALAMGKRASTVASFQNSHHDALSLGGGLPGDEEMVLLDVIPDERMRPDTAFFEKESEQSISDQVLDVVENLPYPQGAIIKLRFGLEMEELLTLDSTAARLGMSIVMVQKHEWMAKNVLRRKLSKARKLL